MPVFGYTRVSSKEQAKDGRTGLETQRQCIGQVAVTGGLVVDSYHDEAGVSGSKALRDRPVGGPLLGRLRRGDTLIVAKLDRAFRNAADALSTAEALKDRRVDLIIADVGSEPVTQHGVSRMFFGMLALVAEFEREWLRERVGEGREAKRAAGGHIGGAVPFGYRKVGEGRSAQLQPIEAEQAAIVRMAELRRVGLSLRSIATEMQSAGHRISHVTVKSTLAALEVRARPYGTLTNAGETA